MKEKIGGFLATLRDVKQRRHRVLYRSCVENFLQRKKTRKQEGQFEDFFDFLKNIWKEANIIQLYKTVLMRYRRRELTAKKEAWLMMKEQKNGLPDILSKREIEHLLEVIVKPTEYLILSLAYGAWLKVSEVVHLQVADLDLAWWKILIKWKWKEERYVPMPKRIQQQLQKHVEEKQLDDYVFPGRKWAKLTPRSIQYIFKKNLKKSQIAKKISINALRHSFAVHLLEQWVDIHYIKRLLWHKNIRTTQIYKKLVSEPISNILSPL